MVAALTPAALPKRRGRPRAEDRRTLNGILHVLRSGCRWQDMPSRYGSPIILLEDSGSLAGHRDLGSYLPHPAQHPRRAGEAGVGPRLPGRHLRASKNGGPEVGLTRWGTGSKLMLVVEGHGVPIGGLVTSDQGFFLPHEEHSRSPIARFRLRPNQLQLDQPGHVARERPQSYRRPALPLTLNLVRLP